MNTIEDFKSKVSTLVELFERNESFYKSKEYKEDQLRQQFLNPFFKALGWDMDNEQGYAPQYCEVIHEDRIEIHGKPKAPDYSFRIGGVRKFFVEAKASSINIEHDFSPAFQLRRYAWSGRLPVSILLDFEDFVVYDCTIEPKQTDRTDTARIKIINYKDYLDNAEYIYNTFSKDAILKGSFDVFAKAEKRGNQLVDKSFLNEIETWRNLLAKDIAIYNESIDIYELNDAVQRLIDRIIFLRIAEDRGIEDYENLKKTIESADTYKKLLQIFKKAQDKYNSNLFNFNTDKLTDKLVISDKVLNRIISTLYYPKSPFEFSVIGVEILGSVYEQFLGKVIRLTKGHNAIIEEKPEVKKAGGVYYTPQYIVDYIVKNTIGELVKDKTPKEVAKLKICDPAMGSGSFLLGAYSFLLEWYLNYYIKNNPEKLKNEVFKDSEGNYILTSKEKKRILLNNIYGVDIDAQAVEVTKLSLALKMLENENRNTLSAQMKLFEDRILPDLSSNIKCGNSLIGSDYYSDKNISLLGDEEIRKVNAFDWDKEFAQIFQQGGFDIVIGNPPYISNWTLTETNPETINYLNTKYEQFLTGHWDMFICFIALSISILNNKGKNSFILPTSVLKEKHSSKLRLYLLNNLQINEIIDFGEKTVFDGVARQVMIYILSKTSSDNDILLKTGLGDKGVKVSQKFYLETRNQIIKTNISSNDVSIYKKINGKDSLKLGELMCINTGVVAHSRINSPIHFKKDDVIHKEYLTGYKKYIIGSNMSRYYVEYKDDYIDYDSKKDFFHRPKYSALFESPKIIIRRISGKDNTIIACVDRENYYSNDNLMHLVLWNDEILKFQKPEKKWMIRQMDIEIEYILGIILSKLIHYYFKTFLSTDTLQGSFSSIYPEDLRDFPIKICTGKEYELLLNNIKELINLYKLKHSPHSTHELIKTSELKIVIIENQINNIVYKIYELTSEEIDVIEKGFIETDATK